MSKPRVHCPDCRSAITTPPRKSGKYWCDECDGPVLGVVREAPRGDRVPSRRADGDRAEGGSGALVAGLIVGGVLLLVGLGVGGYFALRPKAVETAGPPVPVPAGAESVPPPPVVVPTPEEIVRRVKGAAVYVRTTQRPGQLATGSGFFAGKPGFVVTNAHVVGYGDGAVRPPVRVEVVIASGEPGERTRPAEVYGVDVPADLALLKVSGDDLPTPLPFGKAAELVETQEVVIYGYPFGEMLGKNISVNRSTVSSLRRESGRLSVVQLGGGLNPGNSGGPVTNARGEVIGVSVAKLRGAETIGFAIPAETAAEFVDEQHRAGGRFVLGGGAVAVAPIPKRPPPFNPRPPAKPPANLPDAPPLILPPVKPVAITPADLAAKAEVKLPAEADQACLGGGGRFLVLNLPKAKQLAVFDISQAKVVKYLPAPAEKVLIAAGMDKLVVVDPDKSVIQRWNLITFEKEVTAPLPATAGLKATAIGMGSASNGPLLVQGLDFPRLGEWFLFDVTTMKEVPGGLDRHNSGIECRPNDRVLACGDGRTVVVNRREGGASLLAMSGARWTVSQTPWQSRGPVFPSADGGTVYGIGDLCSPNGKRVGQAAGGDRFYVPAASGPLVLAITDKKDSHEVGRGCSVAVHAPRDTRPMFHLPPFEALRSLFVPNEGWSFDGHVFFVPQAAVVAVLPKVADRIVLYPVDVAAELAKTDLDYLFVASQPPPAAPGKRFEYQIDAKAKAGGLRYKLDFGPTGLSVAENGVVTWDAPAGFGKPVNVAVTVSDKSGQEVIHSFELVPVTPR